MHKNLWIVWLQGWQAAPPLVLKCLASWQQRNPDWTVRALAMEDVRLLLELPDLTGKIITSASFSDLVRAQLLYEYGGVWVDATLLCRRPLNDWLPSLMAEEFFAFERTDHNRPLASWFLAAEAGHPLLGKWWAASRLYWLHRFSSDDYFWFHHLFQKLCSSDPDFRDLWNRVPKISGAEVPHRAQDLGFANEDPDALTQIDQEQSPVLKLTHRYDSSLLERNCLLNWLLVDLPDPQLPVPWLESSRVAVPGTRMASLSVRTQNLGDHIQILAANRLLQRLWHPPSIQIDRDDGIASLPAIRPSRSPLLIVLNGWFKTNRAEWPPHPMLLPAYVGFHIRLFQCPELVGPAALAHYQQHGPIGCRDAWTCELLRSHGVDAYLSHCLSLTLPRRMPSRIDQEEIFVVSRDAEILGYLPDSIGAYTFISHYVGSSCFDSNLLAATQLLGLYKNRARLIVTTLLHCALPAMAMGIPVVMVWPVVSPAGRESDCQRFSSLLKMLPVFEPGELGDVDWNPPAVDCVSEKLVAFDSFAMATRRWGQPVVPMAWSLAPSICLPPR